MKNKIILITGGTGSFGSKVLEKLLKEDIDQIRIFSRDELKQSEMIKKYKSDKVKFYLGDVRDKSTIDTAMNNVDYVFHAAALKQVPSCEEFPMEAVKTNIIGTENILNSAIENKVKKVICLSTDKAVFPVNSMGISKAMMEKVAISKSNYSNDTVICVTRYGNVMNSRGSVIPFFKNKISNNEDIPLTHKDMNRFLMSLDEAIDLVLFAFKNGDNGDIFVKKSPSASIKDLAEVLIDIYGVNYTKKIIDVGIRPGEKIYETLLTQEERSKSIEHDNFFQVKPLTPSNSSIILDEYNSMNTKILSKEGIKKLLLKEEII